MKKHHKKKDTFDLTVLFSETFIDGSHPEEDFSYDEGFLQESLLLDPENQSLTVNNSSNLFVNSKTRQIVNYSQVKHLEYIHSTKVIIPWRFIQIVEMQLEHDLTCPICLDVPIIPRILQCGHVFCLICLSSYCTHQMKSRKSQTSLSASSQIVKYDPVVYNCPICQNVFKPDEVKMCHFSEILGPQNEIKNQFIEFKLMKQAMGYSVTTEQEKFSAKLLKMHHIDALHKANVSSKYATVYRSQLRKFIDDDRNVLMSYYENGEAEKMQEAFYFAFSHLDEYWAVQIREQEYDLAQLVGANKESPPDDEANLHCFEYYQAAEHPNLYLSALSNEMINDSFRFRNETNPPIIVVSTLFCSTYTKGLTSHKAPAIYRKILHSKPNGTLINVAFVDPAFLDLEGQLLAKYQSQIDRLSKSGKDPEETPQLPITSAQKQVPTIEAAEKVADQAEIEKFNSITLEQKQQALGSNYAALARDYLSPKK